MTKMITLSVDGKKVTVPEGTMVVDAAKQLGINIPVFCYHPKMEPVGMCRMCLVEIGRPMQDRVTGEVIKEADGSPKIQYGPKLETSCTTPVSESMTVVTNSVKVTDARREMLEFLLTSHPLDCPICDKGGECPLQNLTLAYGPGSSRFQFSEKSHQAKHVPLGELIFLDRERCIQCGRCVRFQSEIAGDPVLGFSQRGRSLEIMTRSTPGFDSVFSGNTTDICPVGALTTADFRFGARPWEMKYTSSICNHCPVGCNIVYNVRREANSEGRTVIKRVMPRQNEAVNEIWICDKGRLGYHYVESPKRLTLPMVRKDGKLVEVTWEEAFQVAGRGLSLSKQLSVLVGGHLSNEDLFNLNQLTVARKGKGLLYSYMAGGDLTAQLGLGKNSNLSNLGVKSAVLVVASDLHEEAPLWWLRVKAAAKRGAEVIIISTHSTRLEAFASYIVHCEPGGEVEMLKSFLPENHTRLPESIRTAAETFAKASNGVIFYGSDGLGLDASQAVAYTCANLLIKTDHVGRPDNGLVAVWHAANLQGAWDMGFHPVPNLEKHLVDSDAVLIAAADPAGDDPAMAVVLKSPEVFCVVQELFLTETARLADVVLPVAAATEREGSYTSGERRVQRFYPIQIPADLKPDFVVTAHLARMLGVELEDRSAALVMQQIAAQVEGYIGLTYARLAEFGPQLPDVGRSDLYYGGTSYENRQGLGVQLDIDPIHSRLMKIPEQPVVSLPTVDEGEILLLPVTALYDRGSLIIETGLLDQRRTQPFLCMHPKTAQGLGLQEGNPYCFYLSKIRYLITLKLDESLPIGVGFVARSLGLPLTAPAVIKPEKSD